MSGLDIPFWKQELLKRKQAKLSHEKLVFTQNSKESNSKPRLYSNANSHSSVLNHRSTDSVKKADYETSQKRGFNKTNTDSVYINTKKGSTYNRNITSTVDSTDTRQASGKSKIASVDTGPSRLDGVEGKPNTNTGKYNKNFDFACGVSGSNFDMHGMQKNTRRFKNEEKSNRINDDCENDRAKELNIGQGVESEHISPRDIKRMWQRQATQDETVPKSHVIKSPSPTKEISKSLSPSHEDIPNRTTKVGSNPASVPKAYKSPYAKTQWRRPASVSDETSVKNNAVPSMEQNEVESHAGKSLLSNGSIANNNKHEKGEDEVEHIQSVKSLLGLFGGKAKPNINRKVSDNILLGIKTEKGKDYHTSEIKTSSSKKPSLFKHHSEPNLSFSADNEVVSNILTSPKKSPTSPKKLPTAEIAVEDVALPSHHVSQGIKERMTRLRRASHSNMEDMDGFMEYQNRLNSDMETVHVVQNHELQQTQLNKKQSPQLKDRIAENISVSQVENNGQQRIQKQSPQQRDIIPEKGCRLDNNREPTVKTLVNNHNHENVASMTATQKQSTQQKYTVPEKESRLDNNKQVNVETSVGKQNQEDLFNSVTNTTMQHDNEKPRLAGNVNSNNKVSGDVSDAPNSLENHSSTMNNTQNNINEMKGESQDQPFDKFLSVFRPQVTKKAATGLDLTDTNERKSENKYQNKQSNYVVENSQSDSGLHNDVVSTECLTEIKQNKQEEKPVIKNKETVKEIEEKKPRRKGLNVVDPLAVLQLTKDPILLKEQPAAAELGLIKESPSGKKPKVEIIKHEPDKKAKIAQINLAWDLDNNQPSSKHVGHKNMPASSIQGLPTTPHNVPVTSIDEIPVSVIDDFATNKPNTDVRPKSNITSDGINVGNATFYNGTLSSASGEIETESAEDEEIPVSSIDAEVDLGPPPEIVFDKMPGNLKSSFAQNGKKRGKISFFEHVFIHDYQSETAAAADWDYENGTSFSSYTPAAVKQYEDVSKSYNAKPAPLPVAPPTPLEETRNDEPLITYNEDESIDFTGSSDSTAGALLF